MNLDYNQEQELTVLHLFIYSVSIINDKNIFHIYKTK
jgi:hypothetical protein